MKSFSSLKNKNESTQESEAEKDKCSECGGQIVNESDEYVCSECGLIIEEDTIDHGPEWRAYNSEQKEKRKRTGQPLNISQHDYGLTSHIDSQDKDIHGNSISNNQRRKFARLRKLQSHARQAGDRTLIKGIDEIKRMRSTLGLPKPVEKVAIMTYRRCYQEDKLPGRSIEAMASAALSLASRLESYPRSLTDISNVSRVDRNEIASAYQYINRELNLEVGPATADEYIPRYISRLEDNLDDDQRIPQETQNLTTMIVDHVRGSQIESGRDPNTIAAGALYYAIKLTSLQITQQQVADACGITPAGLRARYQEIIAYSNSNWILNNDREP